MLCFRRTIPRVSTAALVLGGGCWTDPTLDDATLRSSCLRDARCDPDFATYYESIDECVLEYQAELRDIARTYGYACDNAVVALLACFLELEGDTCSSPQGAELERACPNEVERLDLDCFPY
ncbi:MAG: hypothetical protein AAGH15_00205 [Myxococcota bacterium]